MRFVCNVLEVESKQNSTFFFSILYSVCELIRLFCAGLFGFSGVLFWDTVANIGFGTDAIAGLGTAAGLATCLGAATCLGTAVTGLGTSAVVAVMKKLCVHGA